MPERSKRDCAGRVAGRRIRGAGRAWLLEPVALAAGRAFDRTLGRRNRRKPGPLRELHRARAAGNALLALPDRDVLARAPLRNATACCGERVGNAGYWGDQGGNRLRLR